MKITTIDLGNMFIKYEGEVKGSFSSMYTTEYQSYQDSFQRIEIDGRLTYIGIGTLSKEFNKVDRELQAQLLYALSKANKESNIETNLTLLLPILQMENKNKLIEMLKNKEFKFKYNGLDRKAKINDCIVLPEGYVTYYSLEDEYKKGSVCIVDIGSRTINLAILEDGKVMKLQTIKLGSYDFYTKIKNLENSQGKDYIEEDIPRLIKNGVIKITELQLAEFMNEVLNSIKPYANLATYKCVFTGGTSLMLKPIIEKLPINKIIHKDPSSSNAHGAMEASKLIWSSPNGDKQK